YREQKQWILRRLSEGFSLFDQQTCSLCSGLSFRSTISFDVHKRGYDRNLKLDMLTAQRGRGRQSGDLIEGARELLYCFSADCASDRCSALPQRSAAFSIMPASVQCRANNSGQLSALSANSLSMVSAMRACSVRRGSRSRVP